MLPNPFVSFFISPAPQLLPIHHNKQPQSKETKFNLGQIGIIVFQKNPSLPLVCMSISFGAFSQCAHLAPPMSITAGLKVLVA